MDPETVYEIISNPDEQQYNDIFDPITRETVESDNQIILDDDGCLESIVDIRYDSVWVFDRISGVNDDGMADFIVFCGWNKDVKSDPPTMKPTKTEWVERTHATWGSLFLDTTRDWASMEKSNLRDAIRSQLEYCSELDHYTELNTRSIGRTVNDGPFGDELSVEWVDDWMEIEADR
jgi:hypothetical protein